MAEVKAQTEEAPPAQLVEPPGEGWEALLNLQPEAEENALPYTNKPEGLPQAAAFPSWDFEQLGEGRGLMTDIQSTAIPITAQTQTGKPKGCPIPAEIYNAIHQLSVSPKVKSIIAATGYVESRWNVDCHHYDNGGMSHGWLQLHGKWRRKTVDWMKAQPGGWRSPSVNLAGFLQTIKEHQKYYPSTKASWRAALAHYNGGSRPNFLYADKALQKSRRLERWFQPQGRVF